MTAAMGDALGRLASGEDIRSVKGESGFFAWQSPDGSVIPGVTVRGLMQRRYVKVFKRDGVPHLALTAEGREAILDQWGRATGGSDARFL